MKKRKSPKKTDKVLDEELEDDEIDDSEEDEDFEDMEEDEEVDDEEEEDEDLEEDEDDEDEDVEEEEEEEEEEDEDLDEDEYDEDEDEEDLEEDEDDGELKGKGSENNNYVIPVVVVLILIIASVATIIALNLADEEDEEDDDDDIIDDPFDNLGNDVESNDPLEASIVEIDPSGEWFEVYITRGGSTDGWKFTTFDEELTTIPDIMDIKDNDQILIYTGSGTSDLDGSDGEATVYLGLSGDVLEDSGDEIALFDSSENLIDFAAWGGGNGDTEREGWNASLYPEAPPSGSSLSLQGEDLGSDSFWTIGPASPLGFNILEVDMSPDDDMKARIVNGRTEHVILEEPGENGEYVTVNLTNGVAGKKPVNKTVVKEVEEYLNFTYNLLKENGFGDAMASGTDKDGNPYIKITVSGNGTNSGLCRSNGEIEVDLGKNKYVNKQTVEHELTHNFQFAKRADGSHRNNPKKNNFIDEGQAEFWGRYSTMLNYNLSWSQIESELQKEGTFNVYEHYANPWIDIFTDWPKAYTRNYTIPSSDYYTGAYLFMKFLMDKFNISILSKVHNAVVNGPGTENDVVGIEAIEKATGKKFEDLLREFQLYMLENRFTQYQKDPKFLTTATDHRMTFNGTSSIVTEYAEQYGSVVNMYVLNGSLCNIFFEPKTNRSRWQITIVKARTDGEKEYEEHTIEKGKTGFYPIIGDYNYIYVIKTRLNGSNFYNEHFNITISNLTIVVPTLPEMGIHIIEDPEDEVFFEWDFNNWIKGMDLRIQLDNSSRFDDPWLDQVLKDLDNMSLPSNLSDGTWWWRMRWEFGGILGPWSPFRNFTLWRNWEMPEFIWDPAPRYYVNSTSNYTIILPNSTVKLKWFEIPEGMPFSLKDCLIEWRGMLIPNLDANYSLMQEFEIGKYMNFSVNYIDWRINVPDFEFPWFRFDTYWYPKLPDFRIIEPENGSKQSQNTSMKIQVDGLPDGDFVVETEFEFTLSNASVNQIKQNFLARLTMVPGVFEVELPLKDLPQGWIMYEVSLMDIYGRQSKPKELHLNISHMIPMFEFITDPPSDTAHFSRNPSFIISFWTDEIDHVDIRIEPETGPAFTQKVIESESFIGPFDFIWHTSGLEIPEGPVYYWMNIVDKIGNEMAFHWEFTMDWTPPVIQFNLPENGFSHSIEDFVIVGVDVLAPDDWDTINQHTARFVIKDMNQDGLEMYNDTMYWNGMYWETSVNVMSYSPGPYRFEAYAWDHAGNCGGTYLTGSFYNP